MKSTSSAIVRHFLRRRPQAIAYIRGNSEHPQLWADMMFYQTPNGVFCITEASGLPNQRYGSGVFGLHIHSGNSCTGTGEDSFSDAGTHYNPDGYPHPYHSGDLPPLFGNNGYALSGVLTHRFSVSEIIGKTVIIHSMPDDFTTQPSGNSGDKIACGVIYRTK